ncbi:MAG: PqqD family peptide modification chaperone [Betaproteobacteria bacterium]
MARAGLNLGRRWAIADGVCTAPVGDHLLLGECAGAHLRLLNPTAALIWNGLEDGVDAPGIARELAGAFGIGFEQAIADVEGMLQAWEGAALVQAHPRTLSAPATAAPPSTTISRHAIEVHCGHYCLGAKHFRIRYLAGPDIDDVGKSFIGRIAAMFAGFAGSGEADPLPTIEFCVGRSSSSVGYREGCWRGDSAMDAFVELCSVLLQEAYGPFDWLCRLHAATLARDGAAIVMPAPAGDGKSTLAAYLAASGWTYFADDTTTLDPHYRALPLPTAIGLKAGSLSVLARFYPGLQVLPVHEYGDKAARYVALDPARPAAAPLEVAAMVFPKYEAGGALSPRRLPAPEAAARLMDAGIGLGTTLTPAKVEWLSRLVQRTPCWALGYQSLPDAEAKLRAIANGSCAH